MKKAMLSQPMARKNQAVCRMKQTKKRRRAKHSWEFSKKLAAWAVVVATASAAASFVLAAMDKQTVSDVSTTIFTACIGYLITYAAKSATEKISRNRHGLDKDGMPMAEERPKNDL